MFKKVDLIIKVFLILIILQFFLHTLVTFGIGIQLKYIWLWKEIFIVLFLALIVYQIIKNPKKAGFNKTILILELIFILLVLITFLANFLIQGKGIGTYILAFKYDLFGFLIFFIFYHLGYFLDKKLIEKIIKFFGKLIKILLVLGTIWYFILLVMPGALKLFGYSRETFSGTLNNKPPAVYLTHETRGIPRNQFIFERPINYGFFLVMFWPLFYILYLRKQKFSKTYIWWWLYIFNLFSTFSRAAIGAWFIELILLGFIEAKHNLKKFIKTFILPAIVLIGIISVIFYDDLFKRVFSDSGHISLVKESINLFYQKPILGYGPASAGPASHWYCTNKSETEICKKIHQVNIKTQNTSLKGFNTENQYLQILIEFGIVGLILWLGLFLFFTLYWIWILKINKFIDRKQNLYLIALSLGVFGLLIEGFVLHSFVDRMIVYPAMLLYGLVLAYYFKNE